ncbi:PREDICTED: cuticle protein 1 [Papilio polytes]
MHQSHCQVERIHTYNMYAKLFVLCVLAGVALAREYPAGLHPAVCPNYPYCDTNTFARFTPDGMPIPEWVYNPSILPVAPADPHANAAPKYPANFNAAACPNYPYCW